MKPCTQCGKCCINYSDGGLSVTAEEIDKWEIFNPEIARYVHDGKIWMDPASGQQLERCPWLREEQANELQACSDKNTPAVKRYSCDIYHARPEDCRYYPVTVAQMVKDDCEMLEVKDLQQPKKIQEKLDKLMEDSRPACE